MKDEDKKKRKKRKKGARCAPPRTYLQTNTTFGVGTTVRMDAIFGGGARGPIWTDA